MKKRIVFLGSKRIGYECLSYLLKNNRQIQADVVAIFGNNSSNLSRTYDLDLLAKKYNVPFFKDLDDILALDDIDIIISIQYHKILKTKHLSKAKKLAVNLHMAPLPEYRGCNQFSYAIYNKSQTFGTTLHKINSGIDSGDILFEKRFDIPEGSFVEELYEMTYEASLALFKESVYKLINHELKGVSQNRLIKERGSQYYFRKEIKALKQIFPSEETQLKIRATSMGGFDPPFMKIGEKVFFIVPEEEYNKNKQN